MSFISTISREETTEATSGLHTDHSTDTVRVVSAANMVFTSKQVGQHISEEEPGLCHPQSNTLTRREEKEECLANWRLCRMSTEAAVTI